jgi:hypothetical protein
MARLIPNTVVTLIFKTCIETWKELGIIRKQPSFKLKYGVYHVF